VLVSSCVSFKDRVADEYMKEGREDLEESRIVVEDRRLLKKVWGVCQSSFMMRLLVGTHIYSPSTKSANRKICLVENGGCEWVV